MTKNIMTNNTHNNTQGGINMTKNTIELYRGMKFEESKMHKILELLESRNERLDVKEYPGCYISSVENDYNVDLEYNKEKKTIKTFSFTMVGGAVLDTILGLKPNDYDIHVEEHGFQFDKFTRNGNIAVENWVIRHIDTKGVTLEEDCYENISKVVGYKKIHFLVDFYQNLEGMLSKFDIAPKMFTYSLKDGLQWSAMVEEVVKKGGMANPCMMTDMSFLGRDFWLDYKAEEARRNQKEKERLEKAKARYGSHLSRIVFAENGNNAANR